VRYSAFSFSTIYFGSNGGVSEFGILSFFCNGERGWHILPSDLLFFWMWKFILFAIVSVIFLFISVSRLIKSMLKCELCPISNEKWLNSVNCGYWMNGHAFWYFLSNHPNDWLTWQHGFVIKQHFRVSGNLFCWEQWACVLTSEIYEIGQPKNWSVWNKHPAFQHTHS